jgi:hypothetical protein
MSHRREAIASPLLKQPGGYGNTNALNIGQPMRLSKIVESSPIVESFDFLALRLPKSCLKRG